MKKIFFSLTILLSAVVANAQFASANITAAGLTCAMCTKAIFNSLIRVGSVSKVDADISNSSFVVKFKDGATVDPDALRSAVEQAGFSVSRFTLTGNFNNIAVTDMHVRIGGKVFHLMEPDNRQATLNGAHTLTLVDRNFVSLKEFKKYQLSGAHHCLDTGKMEECCPKALASINSRIYHVTL